MNFINFDLMKKFKTLLFAILLVFATGNTFAQQAAVSDFVAHWSGTGSDGQSYTMSLNSNFTASIKTGASSLDVVSWKLNFDDGNIVYDKYNHTQLLLYSNVLLTPSSNQMTLGAAATAGYKIYYADVYYDLSLNTLTMVVDFNSSASAGSDGATSVTINFTK